MQSPVGWKGGAIYYVAVIEVDPKWEKNNEGEVDFKVALDEKIEWGIGFRGVVRKSTLVNELSPRALGGIGRRKMKG